MTLLWHCTGRSPAGTKASGIAPLLPIRWYSAACCGDRYADCGAVSSSTHCSQAITSTHELSTPYGWSHLSSDMAWHSFGDWKRPLLGDYHAYGEEGILGSTLVTKALCSVGRAAPGMFDNAILNDVLRKRYAPPRRCKGSLRSDSVVEFQNLAHTCSWRAWRIFTTGTRSATDR